MKRVHTTKKSANRSFDTRATGFPSELYRKYAMQSTPKTDKRFTKPKKDRKKKERTDQ